MNMNTYFYALAFIKDYFQCRIITHSCSLETVSAGQWTGGLTQNSVQCYKGIVCNHLKNLVVPSAGSVR